MDSATLANALIALDIESCAGVLVHVIQARPELAPVVVNATIPALTYAPSSILSDRAQGTIKSFNEKSGFGFVACPDLQAKFGRDVFVHTKQFKAGNCPVGSAISFAVVLNKDNQPQAFDICDAASEGMGGSGKGSGTFGKGLVAQNMAIGGKGKGVSKGPDIQQELGQGAGILKTFNAASGYGFIDCPEIKEMGYQDVFVHHAQVGNFQVGDEVIFSCYLNKKGQPQAMDLVAPEAPSGGLAPKKWAPQTFPQGTKSKKPGDGHSNVTETLGTSTGTIKSFSDKNGYGFIDCPEVKEMGYNDVFLLQTQKGDFNVGEFLQFTVFVNDKGKIEAKDLAYAEESPSKKRRF